MAARLLRIVLALLPLAVGLFMVRLMPQAVPALADRIATWRLDPLALGGLVLLPLGTARVQVSLKHALRLMLGTAGLMLALAATSPLLQLLLIYGSSVMLLPGLGPRWFVAFGFLMLAHLPLQIAALVGAGSQVAHAAGTIWVLPALVLAALAGLGCVPWPAHRSDDIGWERLLRPFWLFPLLRSLETGPWPIAWTLLVPLLGTVAAVGAAIDLLRARDARRGMERLLAVVLGMALVCGGLNTTPGVAGAVWVVLAHGLLLVASRGGSGRISPPACLLLLFVAGWWTAAAATAAGAFLVAGLVWLAGMAGSVAPMVWPDSGALPETPQPPHANGVPGRGFAGAVSAALVLVLLALFAPLLTEFLALPVADQLGAGLTPFGLLDIWPWIGMAALDAAHRRAALLPSVALTPLLLVTLAVTWLLLRLGTPLVYLLTRRSPLPRASEESAVPAAAAIQSIRNRVWWVRARRDG